jgi:hypothetical protein
MHIHVGQHTFSTPSTTLLGAVILNGKHAIGVPEAGKLVSSSALLADSLEKELYEPLCEELYPRLEEREFRRRGIWIADMANLGLSSMLSESKLGSDGT